MIIELVGYPPIEGQRYKVADHIICIGKTSIDGHLFFHRTNRIRMEPEGDVVVFELDQRCLEKKS